MPPGIFFVQRQLAGTESSKVFPSPFFEIPTSDSLVMLYCHGVCSYMIAMTNPAGVVPAQVAIMAPLIELSGGWSLKPHSELRTGFKILGLRRGGPWGVKGYIDSKMLPLGGGGDSPRQAKLEPSKGGGQVSRLKKKNTHS